MNLSATHPAFEDIAALFERQGSAFYGEEPVSQLEHALQCGLLAEEAGEPPAQIIAALLHDAGHMLIEESMSEDRRHQEVAVPYLSHLGDGVAEAIRLHVAAKRYLCAIEPGYFEALSAASQRTLLLQGGIFDAVQAAVFIAQPWAAEAVRLRRYDDHAKVCGLATPNFAHFRQYFAQLESAA